MKLIELNRGNTEDYFVRIVIQTFNDYPLNYLNMVNEYRRHQFST